MKQKIKNTLLKYTTLLLVAVITLLCLNQSANIHSHRLSDGTIITHAHPYNKTSDSAPLKSHHHNVQDSITLRNITHLFVSLFVILTLSLLPLYNRPYNIVICHKIISDVKHIQGRAPPLFYSL